MTPPRQNRSIREWTITDDGDHGLCAVGPRPAFGEAIVVVPIVDLDAASSECSAIRRWIGETYGLTDVEIDRLAGL